MYESFFGLKDRPFQATPSPERYFAGRAIEAARQSLGRCIERGAGIGLVVGPAGTGKTLLCQVLASDHAAPFQVALLASGRMPTRRALLQAICYELGLPYRGVEEGELRLALIDRVARPGAEPKPLVLLVDEAHSLPWRLLEELRMITNLVRGGQPCVRLVLAGSPSLEERFSSPRLASFGQRIVARCYLEPLGREETAAYVAAQLQWAGSLSPNLFDAAALERIHLATDGVVRLVNQLCDHALLLAGLAGQRSITAAVIEEAWSDLQQLPTPWSSDRAPAEQVVEFGRLDDAESEVASLPLVVRGEDECPDVERQLQDVAAAIDELDDDFRPAGTIGPEVELSFDPFGEPFQQEEVVLDRFAQIDTSFWDSRPQVSSREGDELSELLDQFSQLVVESAEASALAAEPAAISLGTAEGITIAAPWTPSGEEPDARQSLVAVGDEDADLLVIEDDPPAIPTPATVRLVRPHEYRQLFATLRRG